jgi:tRNA-dihydrouridine synthase B
MHFDSHIAQLALPLTIGNVVLPNRVLLAPMSGVSDRPFRAVASRFGVGAVVSEMIAGDQLASAHPVAALKAERAGSGPYIIQIAGRQARWMAEGAKAATDAGADIIDINMGCPARKVTKGYSGSALMRDLDHALTLIEATVAATDRPVTLKMRLGWDERTLNAPELAKRAEDAGICMVTVHGRTRCQFYRGSADWAAIAEVKAAVKIPVIANGDLVSVDHLGQLMRESAADGIMIGRGAYGRPWFPGHVAGYAATGQLDAVPAAAGLLDLIADHYSAILTHYGDRIGMRAARKHLGWYLSDLPEGLGLATARRVLLTETRPAEVMRLLREFPFSSQEAAAA